MTKTAALVLMLIAVGCTRKLKPTDCSSCHIGRFAETMLPNYVITRTKTEQLEEWKDLGQITESKLIWIDDCTYITFGLRTLEGPPHPVGAGDTMKVTITVVDAEGYDYEAVLVSSNPELDGRAATGRLVFLKE